MRVEDLPKLTASIHLGSNYWRLRVALDEFFCLVLATFCVHFPSNMMLLVATVVYAKACAGVWSWETTPFSRIKTRLFGKKERFEMWQVWCCVLITYFFAASCIVVIGAVFRDQFFDALKVQYPELVWMQQYSWVYYRIEEAIADGCTLYLFAAIISFAVKPAIWQILATLQPEVESPQQSIPARPFIIEKVEGVKEEQSKAEQ